ncbi:MAG TPA: transporter substrate-binding domain-containing protein [Thermoanaerobaculia bacterium]|nr:transporter substrate-binding domain-containing protein [Thermoanaerobaculia bacterium]
MSGPARASRRWGRGVAAAAAAACAGSLAAPLPAQTISPEPDRPLRVCLLEHDLPRADRASQSGFDLELMRALAERLDRRLELVWRPSAPSFSEIEDSELPLGPLAAGDCDLTPSVPGRAALGDLAGRLELTRPYYGAAFELAARDSGPAPRTFDQLAGETVAVQLQTLAQFAVHRRGFRWLAAPTTREVLALFESGEATTALVWGPALARAGVAASAAWQPPPFLRWNEHLAVRRQEAALLAQVDGALGELLAEGVVAALAERYGILRQPFDEVFDPSTWNAALEH